MKRFIQKIFNNFIINLSNSYQIIIYTIALVGGYFLVQATNGVPQKKFNHVAITQIVSHPSLDQVRAGIVDELKVDEDKNGERLKIDFSNAMGDIAAANQIARRFVELKPDVMVGIATQSAQALLQASKNTNIPIVFATITDPVNAKLVKNLKKPEGRVTGTRNMAPLTDQVKLMFTIFPKVKNVGVCINSSESNSIILLNQLVELGKEQKFNVLVASITDTSMITDAVRSLVGKVDVLMLFQDNTVASGLAPLLKTATDFKLPVMAVDIAAVKQGALAGVAYDEYHIGRQTGRIIKKILAGKKPSEIPVEDPEVLQTVINAAAAKVLGVQLPTKEQCAYVLVDEI